MPTLQPVHDAPTTWQTAIVSVSIYRIKLSCSISLNRLF